MALATGTDAPDFTLKDQDGNDVTLSSFRGNQNVVIVFYPVHVHRRVPGRAVLAARRPLRVRERQRAGTRDLVRLAPLAEAMGRAAGLHVSRAERLLASRRGGARAYDVFNEQLGCANRATFVIDKQGKIVDVFESPNLGTAREKAAYEAALAKL